MLIEKTNEQTQNGCSTWMLLNCNIFLGIAFALILLQSAAENSVDVSKLPAQFRSLGVHQNHALPLFTGIFQKHSLFSQSRQTPVRSLTVFYRNTLEAPVSFQPHSSYFDYWYRAVKKSKKIQLLPVIWRPGCYSQTDTYLL